MPESEEARRSRIIELRKEFNLQDKTDPRIDELCLKIANASSSGADPVDLRCIDLSGGNFGTRMSEFLTPIVQGNRHWHLVLSHVNLDGANLSGANLDGAEMSNCNLNCAVLTNAGLKSAGLENCSLDHASLSQANLEGAILATSSLSNCWLAGTVLRKVSFKFANLDHANLNLSDISGADFEEAILSHASLVKVTVDQKTVFTNIRNPTGCKITRLTLDSLENFGGLTVGNLSKMQVIDDVARLRQTFGGPWFWSHVCLVICFFLPYVWFIVERLLRAYSAAPSAETISLGRSLWNFIWSGGVTWTKAELNAVSFICFVLFSLYNVLRITFLWKTARLETDQFVTKIPSDFSLDTSPYWNAAYVAVDWLKYLAILVALIHTYHFLSVTMVPINQ